MKPEIDYAIDSGSTTSEETNEDYLWIGPEDGVNAVLILDGTSGTAADFGRVNDRPGGRRYVEKFGEYVKERLLKEPSADLEEVMEDAISYVWDAFDEEGESAVKSYFKDPASNAVIPTGKTIPGAVGSLTRWDEDRIEILHVGDVETYIVSNEGNYQFGDEVHERFDEIFEEKIRQLKKKGIEEPRKRPEVTERINKHREAANLPGTYPNMSFNPLAVKKQGMKLEYNVKEVEKVLLSTDGASPRLRHFFDLEDNEEVTNFVEERGAERSLELLREKEGKVDLNTLKSSDDAAIALLNF